MMSRTPFEAAENLPLGAVSLGSHIRRRPPWLGYRSLLGLLWHPLARTGLATMRSAFLQERVQPGAERQSRRCRRHAQGHSRPGDRAAAEAKSKEIVARLRAMRPKNAAEIVEQRATETFTYYSYHSAHWR